MLAEVVVQYIFDRGNANNWTRKFVHVKLSDRIPLLTEIRIDEMLYSFTETFFRASSIGNGLNVDCDSIDILVPQQFRCLREDFSFMSCKARETSIGTVRAYVLRDQLNFRREPDTAAHTARVNERRSYIR